MTLRNTRKNQQLQLETRQDQLFMNLYKAWRSPDFHKQWHTIRRLEWRDYDDFSQRYGEKENDIEVILSYTSVMTFFDGIRVLVKNGLVDMNTVYDLLSTTVLWTWEQYEPIMRGDRENFQRPQMWDDFEFLYNEVKKREQQAVLKT